MSAHSEFYFPSSDGKTQIHVEQWLPEGEIKAVLQISHGVSEYVGRYAPFAEYLAEHGFAVIGGDHLGHGKSVAEGAPRIFFGESDGWNHVVDDVARLRALGKEKFPNVPYFIMGHSMGSYMLRRYLIQYGDDVDGAVILGTGNQPMAVVEGGILAAKSVARAKGERYRSRLLSKLMFGAYNTRITDAKSENAWLTRDEEIVELYDNDDKCSFVFTPNAYLGFLNIIKYDIKPENVRKTPASLPVLFASGLEDPVGDYGKGVKKAFMMYTRYLDDVELRLYEDCRHELHSELNRYEIFDDIYRWMQEHL